MTRVALAIPTHGQIHKDTMSCISGLQALSLAHGREIVIGYTSSSLVGNARNAAVDFAQQVEATHLLMIDSDMVFPPWMLEEYLRHDVDVIGTPYRRRASPWGMMGKPKEGQDLEALRKAEAPAEFEWLATGLMMVKTSIFERLPKPYWRHPIDGEKLTGEDLAFCREMNDMGVPIWGLLHLPRVGHIIEAVLWNDALPIMPVEQYDMLKLKEALDGAGSQRPN